MALLFGFAIYCVHSFTTNSKNFWIKQINFLLCSLHPHNFPGRYCAIFFILPFLLVSFRHQLIHYFSKFISIGCLLFCIINIFVFVFVFAQAEPFMFNTKWRQWKQCVCVCEWEWTKRMWNRGNERPEWLLYTHTVQWSLTLCMCLNVWRALLRSQTYLICICDGVHLL